MCSKNTQLTESKKQHSFGLELFKNKAYYLSLGLGFLCSRRGSNLLFPAHCLLSKGLVAALIVTEEGGAETIADNNSKTIQYIFPQGGIL